MRDIGLVFLAAVGLQACAPAAPEIDLRARCEVEVRKTLLNPETAEFHDFTEVDAEAFTAAVIPPMDAEHNYPAGKIIVDGERNQISSAAHLYRMRVRAAGQLGNRVTKQAFCRQPVEGQDLCFCTVLD